VEILESGASAGATASTAGLDGLLSAFGREALALQRRSPS